MSLLRIVPLLLLPYALYHVMGDMSSYAFGNFTMGHVLTLIAIICLYAEIFKSTRTGTSAISDHMFSMLLFVGALVEYILSVNKEPTLLLLIAIMFVDVVGGFTITIRGARRDMNIGGGGAF